MVHHEDPADALSWRIGDVTISRVEESVIELPWRWLLPDATPELIDDCRPWIAPFVLDDPMTMLLSMHTFVVQSGGLTVVVDTCVGGDIERPLPGDPEFGSRLDAAIPGGFAAVDIVLCTHLHFDHVGLNTQLVDGEWLPTFPNARYLMSTDELASTLADDHMDVVKTSVQPLLDAGLVDAVTSDHRIDRQLRLAPSPGHTPGHVHLVIESTGATAMITGDLAHHPIQLRHTDIAATHADADSEGSRSTRRSFVRAVVDRDVLVLGTHFAPPVSGYLVNGPSGIEFR
jgi:glyoxylase-like metal-dependent hydrolase (beta-lactamase superfamily II)